MLACSSVAIFRQRAPAEEVKEMRPVVSRWHNDKLVTVGKRLSIRPEQRHRAVVEVGPVKDVVSVGMILCDIRVIVGIEGAGAAKRVQ